jgi:hypothetical protein
MSEDAIERKLRTAIEKLRTGAELDEFFSWRKAADCDSYFDVWTLALGWFSGRGHSREEALRLTTLAGSCGARVPQESAEPQNLVRHSEEFDKDAWVKSGSREIAANDVERAARTIAGAGGFMDDDLRRSLDYTADDLPGHLLAWAERIRRG